MNLKHRINAIFQAYNVNLAVAEEDVVTEEVKEDVALAEKALANGTIIYTDAEDFVVGAQVFIVNEEGERMPLPDGEYEYDGGGKTVVAEGTIAEILEEIPEEEEVEAQDDVVVEEDEELSTEATFTQSQVSAMIAKALTDSKKSLSKTISRKELEIASLKKKMSTQAAENGLRRSAKPRLKKSDLSQLSRKERIAAIHEIYS